MNRNESPHRLIPAVNCWVTLNAERIAGGPIHRGQVVATDENREEVQVRWGLAIPDSRHKSSELRNGFRPGDLVQDSPLSNIRRTVGTGIVQAERHIAARDMVLVQWHKTGESAWIPFENLVRLRGPETRYVRAELEDDSHERFRLKAFAYALDSWNQVTGALDRLDVDPLPHQIDLVHRILTSDQTNWLIADDVGLGKTIEVGLLLAALRRRRQARRVLVVCPAAVVRQWQDEMSYKFNEDFRIFGVDFNINQPSHWFGQDKVIVSIDRGKSDENLAKLADAGEWDIIIFDEAHHLSKVPGRETTQRYRLAQHVRKFTDSFIFLTGTPHQGDNAQFVNMLTLLRPDRARELGQIFTNPSVVAEMVLRNRKSAATDMNGEPIFRGQDSHAVDVPSTDKLDTFDKQLKEYLRKGYKVAEEGGGLRAVGFVMTTYRKLASSSITAVETALLKRLARLQTGEQSDINDDVADDDAGDVMTGNIDAFIDGSDGNDNLEALADVVGVEVKAGQPFFQGEAQELERLIALAEDANVKDPKMQLFLEKVVKPVREASDKLLVFTEYRATQEYIADQLKIAYPGREILQIHGGMSLNEKKANIAKFNESGPFLISTEAGGEGINLHRECHVMVNYDIPWNPARLIQRAGRLYRYGQTERVVVFNMMSTQGFDNQILARTLERVDSIAQDLAEVSGEYGDPSALKTEILGEILERLDIAKILADASEMSVDRTQQDAEEALKRAHEAKNQQDILFSSIEGYDPNSLVASHRFTQEDVHLFLEIMLPYFRGIEIRESQYDGRVLVIRLPDLLRGQYSDFPAGATVVRITADRQIAQGSGSIHLMDFKSRFFTDIIECAQSPDFGGEYASIRGPDNGALGLYRLRWQNDQGVPNRDDVLPVFIKDGSDQAEARPTFFGSLLGNEARGLQPSMGAGDPAERRETVQLLQVAAETELADQCTKFRHPNDIVLLAAADIVKEEQRS